MELDELCEEHDAIYEEIRECYGLERCLKASSLLYEPRLNSGDGLSDHDLGAGALIASLKRDRENFEGNTRRFEAELREKQRQEDWRRRQQSSSSSSSSSSSYSFNSYKSTYSVSTLIIYKLVDKQLFT